MPSESYKKMAGTSAVFVLSDIEKTAPIERDGESWSAAELKLEGLEAAESKAPMASVLALEGLEEYDPPSNGDVREVTALGCSFVYVAAIRGWVQRETPSRETKAAEG